MQSEQRLQAIERATSLPLIALAFAMLPLLLVPAFVDLSASVHQTFVALDWIIWALFAADFFVKLAVAPARVSYIRSHPLEMATVVLPFLRPIRALRFLRLARVATLLGLNVKLIRDIFEARGTRVIGAACLVAVTTGAFLTYLAERNAEGANIHSFEDALWWAATTMTTVGYGDRFPTTPEGRAVAIVLMLFGIAALSALTAAIAASLVRDDNSPERDRIDDLLDEVRALRSEVEGLRNGVSP